MILTILVAIFALVALMVLHEFGHFALAKKFGADVEEFGVGYPPRLFGKKFGETVYSINLIPFGAFVKIKGEQGGIEEFGSFSEKALWQRALIILGGVIMFWVVAAVLLSVVLYLGMPTAVSDAATDVEQPEVKIGQVMRDSPAAKSGLKPLDTIVQMSAGNETIYPTKVKEVQEFTKAHQGEEITLTLDRWGDVREETVTPRINPSEGEGAMGITLARTAVKSYPAWKSPIMGTRLCFSMTIGAVKGLGGLVGQLFQGKGMPPGSEPMGPIGIFSFLNQTAQAGVANFLRFVALISIFLAIFNILPIPALDGGKLVFLGIEAVRGEPVSPEIEEKITNFFFGLLLLLMLIVTIKFDIPRLF
ncbi:MAG: M50 family metallopeptidase, partial [Candidatus Paceibacterota bacterium]